VILALVLLLGVDLWLAVTGLAIALMRRRAVKRARGAFRGKIRLADGEIEGLSQRWKGGYGRWVRDVLVWHQTPLLFRTMLIPVDGADSSGSHAADPREVGRLGNHPVIVALLAERHSRVSVAARDEDRERALGPFALAPAVGSLVPTPFSRGAGRRE
jgi:hypothetical protein